MRRLISKTQGVRTLVESRPSATASPYSSRTCREWVLNIGPWSLKFLWSLDVGVWNFGLGTASRDHISRLSR